MYILKLYSILLSVIVIQLISNSVNGADVCTYVDPIKSCECYFDGQHFSVQCVHTKLEALPITKDIPKDVEALDVSYNSIKELKFDDGNYQSRLMRTFRAAHNKIEAIPENFLSCLPHLTTLDLSHNQISNLSARTFESVSSLHYLDLSFNEIHQLTAAFAPIRNLRYLDLSYNDLGGQLMTLNSLFSSGLGFNTSLETLKMNAVNLTTISNRYFENLTLTALELADNGIEDVPLLPDTLVTLDLSGNYFNYIAPSHLVYPQLKELYLNRLRLLEDIHNYAFYNLLSLEILEVEHCSKLKAFNDKAFGIILEKEEWNLTRISLNGNGLRRLNQTYFHLFNKLEKVDLSSNPWICDCDITWFKLVQSKLINQRTIRCVAPRKQRNMEVLQLDEERMSACNAHSNMRTQKILTSVICILVVVLLVVILYLIYLAPHRGNQNDRFIGEESPYHNIVVRDDNSYIDSL